MDNEATWREVRVEIWHITSTKQNIPLTCRMETAPGAPTGCYQKMLHRDKGASVTETLLKYLKPAMAINTNKIKSFGKWLKIRQIVTVKLARHKRKTITISHTLRLWNIFQNKSQILRFTQPQQPQVWLSSRNNSSFNITVEEIQLPANQCLMFT